MSSAFQYVVDFDVFLCVRTGLSVQQLLDRVDVIKGVQHQADAELLKRVAEKMKQHESPFSSAEDTGKSLKAKNKQSLHEQKRRDAPPYKVIVFSVDMFAWLTQSRSYLPSSIFNASSQHHIRANKYPSCGRFTMLRAQVGPVVVLFALPSLCRFMRKW